MVWPPLRTMYNIGCQTIRDLPWSIKWQHICKTINPGRIPLLEKRVTFFFCSFIHLIQTNEKLNNREDTAEALAKRNILRQVKMIQTSSNIKFVSIEFDTFTTMETFCLERLSLKDNSLATFIPGYKKPNKKPKKYTFINFLN